VRLVSMDPVSFTVEGGAFENPKAPRQLNERGVTDVLGRLFFRVKDRIDPAFGTPPEDSALTLQQSTAWDTYAVGRTATIGYDVQKPRRQYHFRNRHGFTDAADQVFER